MRRFGKSGVSARVSPLPVERPLPVRAHCAPTPHPSRGGSVVPCNVPSASVPVYNGTGAATAATAEALRVPAWPRMDEAATRKGGPHVSRRGAAAPAHVQRTAVLLTSELVTDALIRDRMPATLRCRTELDCPRVEVTDTVPASPRQAERPAGYVRRPPGLVLVNSCTPTNGV